MSAGPCQKSLWCFMDVSDGVMKVAHQFGLSPVAQYRCKRIDLGLRSFQVLYAFEREACLLRHLTSVDFPEPFSPTRAMSCQPTNYANKKKHPTKRGFTILIQPSPWGFPVSIQPDPGKKKSVRPSCVIHNHLRHQ